MCVNWDYISPGDAYANILALPVGRKSLQEPPENSHCSITHWNYFQEISIYFPLFWTEKGFSGVRVRATRALDRVAIFLHIRTKAINGLTQIFFLPLYRMISTHNTVLWVWNAILAPILSLACLIHCIMRKPYWEKLFKECNMDDPDTWVVHGQSPVPD